MNVLHPNDYNVLSNIFFPMEKRKGEVVIFCAANECSEDLDLHDVKGVIGTGKNKSLPGFKMKKFDLVKNPDGSIRWLIPSDCKSPVFLKLYNGSGWRGWLFRTFFQITYAFGLKRFATGGSIQVFYRNEFLNGLISGFDVRNFSIFTGTVGENRKAVFALNSKQGEDWFYKLPLTPQAEKLVQREGAALAELSELDFKKLDLPKEKKEDLGVFVSSVRPSAPENSFQLQVIHLEALSELATQTQLSLPLTSMSFWREIQENMEVLSKPEIVNDLSETLVKKIHCGMAWIQSTFKEDMNISTSIAHGDFTPWNMYLSKEKLHLYDWELSGRMPLLFDAFHFIFQAGILVERTNFETIQERINQLKKGIDSHPGLKNVTASFDQLYQLYLLSNVSYYLARYIGQEPLHEQAHWLVEMWGKAIEEVTKILPSEPKLAEYNQAEISSSTDKNS